MICVSVVKSVISVSISEIFILDGIGGGWYGTWKVIGSFVLGFMMV